MTVRLGKKDYIWSYIGVLCSVVAPVVTLSFSLYFLSEEMYGLLGVFQSIASITTLFDFGFSVTFARNINYCWSGAAELQKTGASCTETGQPNFPLMKRTMRACRIVFLLISGVALLCMLLAGTPYILYISRDLAGPEPMAAWLIYVAAIFLALYFGYYSSFLRGVGAIAAANRAIVIARIANIVLTVLLLLAGFGIVGVAVAYLAYGLVFYLLSRHEFLSFHGIGKSLKAITESVPFAKAWHTFLVIWHNASRDGLVNLSNYLAIQACTLISPLYVSLAATGMYSLAVHLATVLANVAATLYTANQPVLQSAYVVRDRDLTRRTMSLVVVSYIGLFALGMAALLTVGLPILRLLRPATTPTVAVMAAVGLYQFLLNLRNCYTSYFSCTNRLPYVKAFIASSVACVALAVILLQWGHMGVWGLILAQILSQCAYNVWHWPIAAHREMELGARETFVLGMQELKKLLKDLIRKGN